VFAIARSLPVIVMDNVLYRMVKGSQKNRLTALQAANGLTIFTKWQTKY
jgi:hypothetical protein